MQQALQLWRTRLLDLSRRNRALNFKAARVASLTIVDEVANEVFRHLCVEGKTMRFRPTLSSSGRIDGRGESDEDASAEEAAGDLEKPVAGEPLDGVPMPLGADFAPYDPSALDQRHRDDVLQVLATPEALDRSLRRLDEQARATLEEQGVNVLFLAIGMLHYTESADSRETARAPLVMVPIALSRKSARAGFVVQSTDEEPMVNPALVEHLRRMGVTLPADLPEDAEGVPTLPAFLQACTEIAADRTRAGWQGWEVRPDVVVGLFAFQKLVMFKDLEKHQRSFAAHRLVQRLVTRELPAGEVALGLPRDVRDLALDRDFPAESTAQVVDADASQLRAIAAVSKGHDLVIEGPPGTGKSQTITNLIAQALADGKSVLFVAEKMAALQVVHNRLVKAGLGEFCLELHASGSSKRDVLQSLRVSLDASLQPSPVSRRTHRLPAVREELTTYARAVHEPYGALGMSPYGACGLLEAVLDAPRLPLPRCALAAVTLEQLADVEQALRDLAVAAEQIGDVTVHPWRGTARTLYTPGTMQEVGRQLDSAIERLEQVQSCAADAAQDFALPPIRTRADVEMASAVATVFERSPGAPLAVLESDAWNAAPSEATALVDALRTLQRWRGELDDKFTAAAYDHGHAGDIAYVRQRSSGMLGFLAILEARFRTIRRRWKSYWAGTHTPSLAELAEALALVDRYVEARESLQAREAQATALFGALWQGERSDPAQLERYMQWVVDVRGVCVRHGLGTDAMRVAARVAPDVRRVRALEAAVAAAHSAVAEVAALCEWSTQPDTVPFADLLARLREMRDDLAAVPAWGAFERARQRAGRTPAADLVEQAASGAVGQRYREHARRPFAPLAVAFRRALLEGFLEEVTTVRPPLREFETLGHEQRRAEFRDLDRLVLEENRAGLVARLRAAAQQRLQTEDARAGLPFLQRQMARQRRHAPLRRTLREAEATIRAIKPCFLMSPLTVAQYLGGASPTFDLVIFDEASQLPAEDAVGSLARGKQLVVVGDPKQLPPTSFFGPARGAEDVPLDEDGLPIVEDTESVLEEFMGAGIPVTRLRWHYRSAHESLITFSNVSFYDADLYTFPSVETGLDALGLSFVHVPDGVYEGKGLNLAEARLVADAIVQHAKERPGESLGVGTFNLRQQLAILDELEVRRRADPTLEPFFARGVAEPFFVKNLENIQGDERDVIFLSVTYAKGRDGRLRHNFGPINGENGWRRLNVITTRARRRMRVFASMRGDDINPTATSARGARLLREFLHFAEHGRLDSTIARAAAAAESPFEAEVAAELVRRGIRVVPQVGASGYRIDIGVLDDTVEGRFVCGIECDGVAYHASETARDRDRLRQQVLEERGWIIHRVWSTDWFKDRSGQIERLLGLVARAREEAAGRVRVETAAPQRRPDPLPMALPTAPPPPAALTETLGSDRRYVRPSGARYVLASPYGRSGGEDLLVAPTPRIGRTVADVVAVEGPVHVADVAARTATAWGKERVGSRIADRIDQAVDWAVRNAPVVRRGDFLWPRALHDGEGRPPIRDRAGTRIPGDRVPPEELAEAVRQVLVAAGCLPRGELLGEVRQVLGVGKATLAPMFDAVVDAGLRRGEYGEGSGGLVLRP